MVISLKKREIWLQFLKYMVGGGVYFWGGMLIFFVLFSLFHWWWFPAKIMADIFGWSANYGLQRYWAFYDSRLKGHSGQVVFRYVLINGIDLILDYAIVATIIAYGLSPYIGFFVSSAFTMVWDYIWYRLWVFRSET